MSTAKSEECILINNFLKTQQFDFNVTLIMIAMLDKLSCESNMDTWIFSNTTYLQ